MKKSSLTKILIDWVRLFHDINLKNNGVIVIPRFSTVCGSVRTSFGDIGEKFISGLMPNLIKKSLADPKTYVARLD